LRFLTYDCESHPIKPGCVAPKNVCTSAAEGEDGPEHLYDRRDGLAFMRRQFEDPDVIIVGHNVFYDLGQLCAEDPATFVPLVFKALDAFRIRDTIVRQQLIDIAQGNLKYIWNEKEQEYVKTGYHLADLSLRLLGRVLPKTDTWRLKYALLDGIPVVDWPEDARKYAIDDSITTRDVFWAQAHMISIGGATLTDAMQRLGAPPVDVSNMRREEMEAQRAIGGVIPTEERATREAWALWLMSTWGVRTDGEAVAKLKVSLEAEQAEAMAKLMNTGIVSPKRGGGWKKNMQVIYDRVKAGFLKQGADAPTTDKGKVSTEYENLIACGDPDLAVQAEAAGGAKLLNTYVPLLEHGTKFPINARFNVLVESARTSCSKPNLQNLPRAGGAREAFVARPGHVWASVDYDTIELRSLAQSCLDLLGYSEMAEALKKGEDLHLALAAELMGVPYDQALERYQAGDEEVSEKRQFAKCVTGDTLVHTTRGFVPIRDLVEHRKKGFADLKVPLKIVSQRGVECATQGYYGGVQKVFELRTDTGLSVRATADHKFLTFNAGAFRWIKLSDVKLGTPLFFKLGAEVHGNSVKIPRLRNSGRTSFKPIPSFPKKLTPALARVLGILTSEGRCSKDGTGWEVRATQAEGEEAELFSFAMKRVFGSRCSEHFYLADTGTKMREWRVRSVSLAEWLKNVEFGTYSGDKQIPTVVLAAPRHLKVEFMRYLFEGDGSASSMGAGRGHPKVVRYCSQSRLLVQQLQLELLNLGISSRVRSEWRVGYGLYWNLMIAGRRPLCRFRDTVGFLSRRKQAVLRSACDDRVREQPVLFLPGDREAWAPVLKRVVGCEPREALSRPLQKNMPVSELVVDKIRTSMTGDLETAVEDGLWMTTVASVEVAGREEVFDLYEPKHEIAVFGGIVARDCANFGYPGGLGADKFVGYAKAMASVTITLERSKQIRNAWFRRWPEMQRYFEHVAMIAGRLGEGVVISPRSGFVRGGLAFTQLANHYFQSLTATGAKDALWHVSRECYSDPGSPLWSCRPVIFAHDEILNEMPEDRASAAAERQTEVMIDVMKKWIPDIPIKASAVLMRRWYKGAKPVRRDGKLVPSKPVKADGKVKWVEDTDGKLA